MSAKSKTPPDHTDLTGYWSGEYWYDAGMGTLTQFAAHLKDWGRSFDGTTLESADLGSGLEELTARVTGVRDGADVEFTKLYDPGQGIHGDPIFYAGNIDADLTFIEGRWLLTEDGLRLNGGFRMQRGSKGAAAAVTRETQAPVTVDR